MEKFSHKPLDSVVWCVISQQAKSRQLKVFFFFALEPTWNTVVYQTHNRVLIQFALGSEMMVGALLKGNTCL